MSTDAEVEVETMLDELARRGIRIELGPDDKLKVSGRGKRPAELLESLRATLGPALRNLKAKSARVRR
jgi:hypothetical protein